LKCSTVTDSSADKQTRHSTRLGGRAPKVDGLVHGMAIGLHRANAVR